MCTATLAEAATLLVESYPNSAWGEAISRFLPAPGSLMLRLTTRSVVACLLGIAGGLTRMWCHRAMGRFFTWEVAIRDGHQLITHGPYALVRHPSYTGYAMLVVSNTMLLTTPGSYATEAGLWSTTAGRLAGTALIGYMTWVMVQAYGRIEKEDRLLREAFGQEWDVWARRTPCKLIPFVH